MEVNLGQIITILLCRKFPLLRIGILFLIITALMFSTAIAARLPVRSLEGHKDAVKAVSISPDGTKLASGSEDETVKVWDLKTGELLTTLKGHKRTGISSVAFSPDGKMVLSGGGEYDNSVKLWNLSDSSLIKDYHREGLNYIHSVDFSLNGESFLTGSSRNNLHKPLLRLWDTETGASSSFNVGKDIAQVIDADFSPDGMKIAAIIYYNPGSYKLKGHWVLLFDVNTKRLIKKISRVNDDDYERYGSVAFSPNGNYLAYTVYSDGDYKRSVHKTVVGHGIRVLNLINNKELILKEKYKDPSRSIAFSPNGELLAAVDSSGTLTIWDINKGTKLVKKLYLHRNSNLRKECSANTVVFSKDGQSLITGGDDNSIKIVDISPVLLSIEKLTTKIFKELLLTAKPKLQLQPRPTKVYNSKTNLVKDEFESTKAFNERTAQEEIRIKELNFIVDKDYEQHLKTWQEENKRLEQEYQLQLVTFEEDKYKLYSKSIQKAVDQKYGTPLVKAVTYDADNELFDIVINFAYDTVYEKNIKVKVKVDINYARKYKEILTGEKFRPHIIFDIVDNKLSIQTIEELQNPEKIVVERNAFEEANHSISALENFITIHQDSSFVVEAKARLATLQRQKKLAQEKREQKKRKDERDRKLREALYSKKYSGDKVCKSGTTAIILPITITAFVENVNGDNIQLRIVDTEGTSPHYKGTTLRNNTIIWDKYYEWRPCE